MHKGVWLNNIIDHKKIFTTHTEAMVPTSKKPLSKFPKQQVINPYCIAKSHLGANTTKLWYLQYNFTYNSFFPRFDVLVYIGRVGTFVLKGGMLKKCQIFKPLRQL